MSVSKINLNNRQSFWALMLSVLFIGIMIFWAYPKNKNAGAEATIGWDVTGYYYYLPAFFIYKDVKQLNFRDTITNKYHPTPQFGEAFQVENGNFVFKYSSGLAIQFLPGFIIGHLITKYFTDYPSDGFSRPYQLSIAINSFLICILGLWLLRKILLRFFNDRIVAFTLLTLVFGSNYLNYTGFDGAMTHNYVFTLYAILIYLTISFYSEPKHSKSTLIGLVVGLAALTRPTEIISFLIPLLWGVNIFSINSLKERIKLIKAHISKYILAIVACILVGSIQLIYWKYTSGHWIVYSYQDQGFSWLKPHIFNGLFSYRCGWLIYTPIMFFALFGIYLVYKTKNLKPVFSTVLVFTGLFIYIAFAWDIWWYGGSLGQRTMVQTYPVLSIPLAAFIQSVSKSKYLKLIFIPIFCLLIYFNLWWTYQAHFGKYFYTEQITRSYFWNVIGKLKFDQNDLKMLDTNEKSVSEFKSSRMLYTNNFEDDSINNCNKESISGKNSLCIGKDAQFSPEFCFNINQIDFQHIRSQATFRCFNKEWEIWRSIQFIVKFKNKEEIVKEKILRVERFYDNGKTSDLYFDIKIPKKPFDKICIAFWNANGNQLYLVDDLKVEALKTN